jgi:hypothetical protein
MYIPRPAKLLFTVDNKWNRSPEKFGSRVAPTAITPAFLPNRKVKALLLLWL